ncbi:MAG: hypothetical protein LAP85_29665 [Acidobacteriia bacterium]|nr:hypothetical protein [Terriglobia bacterium]
MIGKTLGHYQITSQIAKGGMVDQEQKSSCSAKASILTKSLNTSTQEQRERCIGPSTQKLGRDVAIKVLPEEFALDADRVARFQREANVLASRNRPNIAATHGLLIFPILRFDFDNVQ